MDELIPVGLGFVLGLIIWRATHGSWRVGLSVGAVAVSALAATVLSGEAAESWLFLLLDLAEAMAGFGSAVFVARRWASVPDVASKV